MIPNIIYFFSRKWGKLLILNFEILILPVIYIAIIPEPAFPTVELYLEPPPAWINVNAGEYILSKSTPISELGESKIEGREPLVVEYDVSRLLEYCRFCFMGRILNVRYECIYRKDYGYQSLAVIETALIDLYWGPSYKEVSEKAFTEFQGANRFVLETPVSRKDCAVVYEWPKFCEFEIGETIFVMGSRTVASRINWIPENFIFKVRDRQFHSAAGTSVAISYVDSLVQGERQKREFGKPSRRSSGPGFRLQR